MLQLLSSMFSTRLSAAAVMAGILGVLVCIMTGTKWPDFVGNCVGRTGARRL
jgi:hypothetical protein